MAWMCVATQRCAACHVQAHQPEEPSPENLLALAREEQADLLAVNEMLQRRLRVAVDVRNKGRQHGARDFSRLDGADARFRCAAAACNMRPGACRVAGTMSCQTYRLK
jgi:hypothetical protein